jgi:CHAT domain
MIRTIITFERLGEQTTLKLDLAPGNFPGLGENCTVDLAGLPDGTLAERGAALVALLEGNRGVRAGLAAALAATEGSAPSPLYFHVRASSADRVEWELIFTEAHGFCALDSRWPVGRIAGTSRPLEPRVFVPPLRIVAVLSAAGRDGQPQLRALIDAVSAADARAIGVGLHVISGDPQVCQEAAAAGATAELIRPTAPGLARQIAQARPHLLHLLGHGGGAAAGVPTLAFANSADFDAYAMGDAGALGSVRLPVPMLIAGLLPCNPWLIVLSACETARAGGRQDGLALAHTMVSEGIPAVIGMRRLVDLTAADRFCAEFYQEALAMVRTALTRRRPGEPDVRNLDWAEALTGPRVVMSNPDPLISDSWTDPVLYAQDDALQVFLPAPRLSADDFASLRGRLDQFRGVLATLDPNVADPAALAEMRAQITALEHTLAQAGV